VSQRNALVTHGGCSGHFGSGEGETAEADRKKEDRKKGALYKPLIAEADRKKEDRKKGSNVRGFDSRVSGGPFDLIGSSCLPML
jgi:hypothetical protein